jgi:CAAX protease family protein
MKSSMAIGSRDRPTLKHPTASFFGLAIALLGAPAFIGIFRLLTGESRSNSQVVGRELGLFFLAALLLWIVKTQEQLPFTSIGAHVDRLGRSLGRGFALGVVLLVVTVGLYLLLPKVGLHIGDGGRSAFQPSPWIVALVVLRAGVVEELFYRGFAIERLENLTGSTWMASLVPLVVFAAAHYRQGLGSMLAAAVLGGILTIFYLKFRDLVANMTAHFFVDFVLNVGLPLVSHA